MCSKSREIDQDLMDKLTEHCGVVYDKGDDQYMAHCPAHADNHPSLAIKLCEDGRLLLSCLAGCRTEDVIDRLGISWSDLGSSRIVEAQYEYQNSRGDTVYAVEKFRDRSGNKSFAMKARDGHNSWRYGIKDHTPIPYNLPRLLEGIKNGETILIVEGEKDVDTLTELGFNATTNHGGAGKWKQIHTEYFPAGTRVIILPDNDKPGKKHAESIKAQLENRSCFVTICSLPDLPPKGDVSDYLKNHSVEELQAQLDAAWKSEDEQDLTICMATVETETISWLWPIYIPLSKITIIEGDPAAGKSFLTLLIAAAVSNGWGFPDQDSGDWNKKPNTCEQAHVLYLNAEDGIADTIRPRLDLLGANCSLIHVLDPQTDVPSLESENGYQNLRKICNRTKAKLLIVDPITAYTGSKVDFYRANETRPIMNNLKKLAEEFGLAIIIIRHFNKASGQKAMYRGLGSIDFNAAARSVIHVIEDSENPDIRVIVPVKNSVAELGMTLGYKINENGIEWLGFHDLS